MCVLKHARHREHRLCQLQVASETISVLRWGKESDKSVGLFHKSMNPIREGSTSELKHFTQVPHPNTIPLGIRISAYELGVRGTQVFCWWQKHFLKATEWFPCPVLSVLWDSKDVRGELIVHSRCAFLHLACGAGTRCGWVPVSWGVIFLRYPVRSALNMNCLKLLLPVILASEKWVLTPNAQQSVWKLGFWTHLKETTTIKPSHEMEKNLSFMVAWVSLKKRTWKRKEKSVDSEGLVQMLWPNNRC